MSSELKARLGLGLLTWYGGGENDAAGNRLWWCWWWKKPWFLLWWSQWLFRPPRRLPEGFELLFGVGCARRIRRRRRSAPSPGRTARQRHEGLAALDFCGPGAALEVGVHKDSGHAVLPRQRILVRNRGDGSAGKPCGG
ncbi:putative extensin [Iris pallida]|uniref:Extensin n=1 Tax=Iris pallida TaxID=29817 RepID=A0AAX6DQ82_IRIPA|nr:putative extensin [Iris pallida]